MEYRRMGRTGLRVSTICLGTMTFGFQTEEQAAHRIMGRRLGRGRQLPRHVGRVPDGQRGHGQDRGDRGDVARAHAPRPGRGGDKGAWSDGAGTE